jgi:hypothetical protein
MKKHSHWIGWVALAALVGIADRYGDRTMSDGFRAASRHPIARPVVVAAALVVNLHLFGVLPRRFDPFYIWINPQDADLWELQIQGTAGSPV